MKNKLFHFATAFKAKEDEDGTIKIAGMASTSDTDRAGDVVLPSAWTSGTEHYKKNPIVLFNHNYSKPIGRVSSISISDKGLSVEAKISSADKEIQQLVKDGVLSTFSVGFMIKEADYLEETDGFLIKEAELFEISVVSVPCNQEATFSVAKSFDNEQEYKEYLTTFKPAEEPADDSAKAPEAAGTADDDNSSKMEKTMLTPEEIAQMVKDAAEKAAHETASRMEAEAKEKAEKDAAEATAAAEAKTRFEMEVKTSAERITEELENRFAEKETLYAKDLADLKEDLASKASEIEAIQNSKRTFGDRGQNEEKMYKEAEDAYIVGLSTGKGWNTKIGTQFLEKAANTNTGTRVPSSEYYETEVSTNIERDIEHALVLAPMFREIQMQAASMVFPVLPDAGYAEFSGTRNALAQGSAPNGNLSERGDAYDPANAGGVDLTQRILSTKKIMSSSYLGNDVEEDAIMPILPLIRESIVRSHARAVEHAILLGNHADGVYGTAGAAFNGLAYFGDTATGAGTDLVMGTDTAGDATFAASALNAADLLALRKAMGKYGMRADDIVFIINERGFYELIEDSEWQDVNQVGDSSAKLKGSVGKVYGTNIIVCDEFATPALNKINAMCVNTRNFIMPRLRGLTMESDYEVVNQRRVLVSTQRLGFDEVIKTAKSVATLQYPAA